MPCSIQSWKGFWEILHLRAVREDAAGGKEGTVCAKMASKKFCFQEQDRAEFSELGAMGAMAGAEWSPGTVPWDEKKTRVT